MHLAWEAVVAQAAAQHGVVTFGQLGDLGASPSTVTRLTRAGVLHRIHHGVYALTPPQLLSARGRWMAAVLACGSLAALSLQPAAALHGLLADRSAQLHVTVATTNGRRRPGIRVHRSATLDPEADFTVVDGIRCTSVHRTIFDMAALLGTRQLERMLDQAELEGVLDMNAIRDQLARNEGRRQNRAALLGVLAGHLIGSTPTANEIEERFLELVREAALPAPEVQGWLDLGDGEPRIRPDFLWREQRVIVETDGWGSHDGRFSFERDRHRDQRIAAAGFQAIRVTWRQIGADRPGLQARLAAVVERVPDGLALSLDTALPPGSARAA